MDRYLASCEIPIQVKVFGSLKMLGSVSSLYESFKTGQLMLHVYVLITRNIFYFNQANWNCAEKMHLTCVAQWTLETMFLMVRFQGVLRGNYSNLHILLLVAKAASFSPWDCSSFVVFLWVVHLDIDWNRTCSRTIDSCRKSEKFWLQSW